MKPNSFNGFGGIPSPADPRDWTLAAAGAPTVYPDSAFIEQDFMVPSNQGKIGSCVGNTFEEVVRKIVYQKTGMNLTLSWRFVYAVCKALDGFAGEGTYPALAAKVIRTYGVPLAAFCPNDVTLDHEAFVYGRKLANIPQSAFTDALNRKAGADFDVPVTEDGIKQAINYAKANNGGVAILRKIGDSYWTDINGVSTWDKAKLLPIRPPSTIVSGHEEFLYGYDYENGRMRVHWLNHWSKDWCDNGRAWEYFDVWKPYAVEIRVSVAAVPPVDGFKYNFTKPMQTGSQGADVVALQHVLKLEGFFAQPTFTGYYGSITAAGVKALQEANSAEILVPAGLTHGTGVVGLRTLSWLQKHYGI